MARPHGERQQDFFARQSFARERAEATKQYQERVQTSARPIVERDTWSDGSPMRVPCVCSERQRPHFHGPEELRRFNEDLRRPPIPFPPAVAKQ
jgi:hypothetical protein